MSDVNNLLKEVREYFNRYPNRMTHLFTLFQELDKRLQNGEMPDDWTHYKCPICNDYYKSKDIEDNGWCSSCLIEDKKEKVIRRQVFEYEKKLRNKK